MAGDDKDTEKKYPYDNLRYSLSDIGSLSDDEKREFGKAEKKRQIRNCAIEFAAVFAIGLIIVAAVFGSGSQGSATGAAALGVILAAIGLVAGVVTGVQTRRKDPLAFVGDGVRRANRKKEKADSRLAEKMHAEMEDPSRPVYGDFYREWEPLKDRGVNPETFLNGWRCGRTHPVDILVDKTGGRMAVCSYYSAGILGVYETERIAGCELRKGGAVLYRTAADGTVSQGVVRGFIAGAGTVVGSEVSKKDKAAESGNGYVVVVLYDDPDVPGISFEFDSFRALAEKAYRAFTELIGRDKGHGDDPEEDVFKDL